MHNTSHLATGVAPQLGSRRWSAGVVRATHSCGTPGRCGFQLCV